MTWNRFNDELAIILFQSFSHLVRLVGIGDKNSMGDEATRFALEFLLDVPRP